MKLTGLTWLAVWLASAVAGVAVYALLVLQGFGAAAVAVYLLLGLFSVGWLIYGFLRWWHLPAVRRLGLVVTGTWAAGLAVALFLSTGLGPAAGVVIGAWAMSICFIAGLLALRLALSFGHPVFGVARTLVDEAIRMKVPLVFIVLLIVLLPVMPFTMDSQDLLRYRIQTFLTWSMFAVSALLSVMTIFLAVGTVSGEIDGRQIFLSMSKPVSRLDYLLGKWLGIVTLNALLLVLCGAAIFGLTLLLARQPAVNEQDWIAVNQRVLVARVARPPRPANEADLTRDFQQRLERLRQEDPVRYGEPDDPVDAVGPVVRREIQQAVLTRWYSLGPRMTNTYRFTDLGPARNHGQTLQLRIKPKAGSATADEMVYLNMRLADRRFPVPPLADDTYHVIDIPSQWIDAGGDLKVEIQNPVVRGRDQPSISFNLEDGIEMLYRVDSFGANFVRSIAILWLRLAFLAMLGIAAGTFLGFPIASLACLMVYVTAAGSSFLNESLEYYAVFPGDELPWWDRITGGLSLFWSNLIEGKTWHAFKMVVRLIGTSFMLLVPDFGHYNPTPLLTDGRLVSRGMVWGAALWIGLLWTGVVGLIGYVIFRGRELARVTV